MGVKAWGGLVLLLLCSSPNLLKSLTLAGLWRRKTSASIFTGTNAHNAAAIYAVQFISIFLTLSAVLITAIFLKAFAQGTPTTIFTFNKATCQIVC